MNKLSEKQFFLLSILLGYFTTVLFFLELGFSQEIYYVTAPYMLMISALFGCTGLLKLWCRTIIINTFSEFIRSTVKTLVLFCLLFPVFSVLVVSHAWRVN